jgi:hypothetical protein
VSALAAVEEAPHLAVERLHHFGLFVPLVYTEQLSVRNVL